MPRTLPMPLENSRVISSAPTNACHWRSASARRNVPRPRSSRSEASSDLERGLGAPTERVGLDRLVLGVVGHALEQRREPREAPRERTGGEGTPGIPVPPEDVDPGTERRDGVGGQPVDPLVERAFGDRQHRERAGVRVRIGGVEAARVDPELGQQAVDVIEHVNAVGGRRQASG